MVPGRIMLRGFILIGAILKLSLGRSIEVILLMNNVIYTTAHRKCFA
jgi:hypothetical protein